MYELALFAGAGGGLLATQWLLGWRAVCYVERDKYAVEVLKARIRDGLLNDAPIWDDVRTFDGRPWRGCVDIVSAGFPCQPWSVAGKREGERDDRNLWPDTIRIVREVRPRWCLLENVPGLLSGFHGYFGQILRDLAESGYDARWRMLSAAEVGAPHRRDRVWVVAYSNFNGGGFTFDEKFGGAPIENAADRDTRWGYVGGLCDEMADADCQRCSVKGANGGSKEYSISESPGDQRGWWETEPEMGRVANGVAHRVDRIRAIGNGQVPAVVRAVWELME